MSLVEFLLMAAAGVLGGIVATILVIFFMGKLVRHAVTQATETLAADQRRAEMFEKMAEERRRIAAERDPAGEVSLRPAPNLPTTIEELDAAVEAHRQRLAREAELLNER